MRNEKNTAFLTREQLAALKQLSEATQRPVAQLIREGVDLALAKRYDSPF